ncbi:MAG: hypothetical protein KDD62_00465, partial [Bdellovibrionales bacterium]|nr:hypothetical protein [Bdellovibrionales bacterium]
FSFERAEPRRLGAEGQGNEDAERNHRRELRGEFSGLLLRRTGEQSWSCVGKYCASTPEVADFVPFQAD